MIKLTELEKTILLAVLSSVRGTGQYVRKDSIVLKFPLRQRKMVERYFDKLVKNNFLVKHPTSKSYRLSEDGFKRAMRLLVEGAILWKAEVK